MPQPEPPKYDFVTPMKAQDPRGRIEFLRPRDVPPGALGTLLSQVLVSHSASRASCSPSEARLMAGYQEYRGRGAGRGDPLRAVLDDVVHDGLERRADGQEHRE